MSERKMKKKIVLLPYDFDSGLGINNEGELTYSYNLEDTDIIDGQPVYTGQSSVLWNNFRDTFSREIRTMYFNLRSQNPLFSYNGVERRFENHQNKWPEAIFNEDAYFKYLQPYLNSAESSNDAEEAEAARQAAEEAENAVSTTTYLPMLQGSKAEQRKWWLYNRFRYIDSKYNAGDAQTDYIELRSYAKGDVTITPYADIYAAISFGSYLVSARATHNQPVVLECPADQLYDTETQIFSASQLSDVGDLSALKVGRADFSRATKLQKIKVGSNEVGYTNPNLKLLTIGTARLLREIDVRNCTNLAQTIDLSGSLNLEKAYFDGTKVTGVTFPKGGFINTIHLPNTILNLTLRDQNEIIDFSLDTTTIGMNNSAYNLQRLYLENTSGIPIESLLLNSPNLNYVRLIDIEWTSSNEATLQTIAEKLAGCQGLDITGANPTNTPVIEARVNVSDISNGLLTYINNNLPGLTVVRNGVPLYLVRWMDGDNTTVLYQEVVAQNGAVTTTTPNVTPTRESTNPNYQYEFARWDTPSAAQNVQSNITINGIYNTKWRLIFKNGDDSNLLTTYVLDGSNYTYSGTNPTKAQTVSTTYSWTSSNGWLNADTNAVASNGNTISNVKTYLTLKPNFTETTRQYQVSFYSESTSKGTYNIDYNSIINISIANPTHSGDGIWEFDGWQTEGGVKYVQGTTRVTGTMRFDAVWIDRNSIVLKYLQGTLTEYDTTATSPIAAFGLEYQDNLTFVRTNASSIGSNAFIGSNKLHTLVLPRTDTITQLTASGVFNNCDIGKGTGGIYVPRALLSTYKNASNWSTYATQIVAIEDYPNFDCTDFTTLKNYTWTQIINAAANGAVGEGTDFVVGATKNLTLTNGTNVVMQLAALNGDVLSSDNTQNAQMTWLCKDIYSMSQMGPSGSQTSWKDGAATMKTTLSDIYALIPDGTNGTENIKDFIVPVDKTTYCYNSEGTAEVNTTSETIWIPSYREVMFGTDRETTGVQYSGLFGTTINKNNRTERVKKYNGTATAWWLRSAYSSYTQYCVLSGGGSTYYGPSSSYGVVFSFCLNKSAS